MHYECEGCGRKLREDMCLQYVHFEPDVGDKSTLFFCPTRFYGRKQYIWCLENTLHAMCMAMDENELNSKISISIEIEIQDPIAGRYTRKTGTYSSLFSLKQVLKSKTNSGYEKKELNDANAKRLAEGDYLASSLWLNEKTNGRAISEIEEEQSSAGSSRTPDE